MISREYGHEEEESLYARSTEGEEEALMYELDDWEDDEAVSHYTTIQRPRWWTTGRTGPQWSIYSNPRWQIYHHAARHRSLLRRLIHLVALAPLFILCTIIFCGIFYPSYSYPPARYLELRDRVLERNKTANINNEKIFIAASLYDHEGDVVSGQWGQAVLDLIHILGKDNVFLSIYENDPDEKAQAALDVFAESIECESQLTTEHLDLDDFPHVATPDGSLRVKRISFLADVRNRALKPLEDPASPAFDTRFDKLLYLNDVVFDPIDAANLLFSTNMNLETGRTEYRAACAVDFINAFKFYDTYATRDIEGYELGVPFYPWFAADTQSRRDVLEQNDAVQVKSCWGGMVAFEAKWFQPNFSKDVSTPSSSHSSPANSIGTHIDLGRTRGEASNSSLRFRASADTYWDGSECCFIHADLSALDPTSLAEGDSGIYMNPYIRVAYSGSVLPWLSFTKRFERLYTPIHAILNWAIDKPSHNPRRLQVPGEEVVDRVWVWDDESQAKLRAGQGRKGHGLTGSFEEVHRTAQPGGFCGLRKLSYINEHPEEGEKHWVTLNAPVID